MNIIDTITKRVLPVRKAHIAAVVVHTSGETDLNKIIAWYTNKDGLQPHYFIETTGTIRRIVPEGQVAYHCKIEQTEADAYVEGFDKWSTKIWNPKLLVPHETGDFFKGYAEWRITWQSKGLKSPLGLVTGRYPNNVSVGIELQQPDNNSITPRIFTPAQYASLVELLGDVTARNQIPMRRDRILGHYDCSPMRRSNAKGNWDPGAAFDWPRVLTAPSL